MELDFLRDAELAVPDTEWRLASNVLYRFGEAVAAIYDINNERYAITVEHIDLPETVTSYQAYSCAPVAIEFFQNLARCRAAVSTGLLPEFRHLRDLACGLRTLHEWRSKPVVFPHGDISNIPVRSPVLGYGILCRENILAPESPLFATCVRNDDPRFDDEEVWNLEVDVEQAVLMKLSGELSKIIDLRDLFLKGTQ